jgi:threonine dehydratase
VAGHRKPEKSPDLYPQWVEEVKRASLRVGPAVLKTPLLESATLNDMLGFRLLVKIESLQRTGSFKFRGALNKLLYLRETRLPAQVLTWSSGNHGAALAEAARLLGIKATVIVPPWIPALKVNNIQSRGAAVVFAPTAHHIVEFGVALAAKLDAVVVSAYDDVQVIAGQSTLVSDVLADVDRLAGNVRPDTVIVPCGGGSLAAGAGLALRGMPNVSIWGAEPVAAADTNASVAIGRRVAADSARATICDALRNSRPGELAFGLIKNSLSRIILIEDCEVQSAMRIIFEQFRIVAEPSGAIAVAAAIREAVSLGGTTTVAIVSGGNVSAAGFCEAMRDGGE